MIKKIVHRQTQNGGQCGDDTPVLNRVLANRGVYDLSSLEYPAEKLLPPENLRGIHQAVEILFNALKLKKRICIVGDFDADGATSTALCIKVLRAMGCQDCDFIVPNRFEFGYGLTPEIVHLLAEKKPDLILTVDNGISSVEGVATAKNLGMQVIITDHHLPGAVLPDADAIVNPNQSGCEFSSKNLAGVGVAFYVLSVLRKYLREKNWFNAERPEPNMADYLDLVALGTVADVVPLDMNNRILVAQGLRRIRAGKTCPGIRALLFVANKNPAQISSIDLGFAVGPRLNAAGRLDDMSLGIQCLLSENIYEAERLAQQLDDLNRERKAIESSMQSEAFDVLTKANFQVEDQFTLCLYDSTWHEGVVGILASRVKDKYHKPVVIFAKTADGQLKGSGRSISGIHLRDVLDELATKTPGLLKKFGGHAMAAGLSLDEDALTNFQKAFEETVAGKLDYHQPEAEIVVDGSLSENEFELETAWAIRNAGPWGQAFPEPLFEGVFTVVQQKILKDKHLKMALSPGEYSGKLIDGILFNMDPDLSLPNGEFKARLVYKLDINEYRGECKLQLLAEQLELV